MTRSWVWALWALGCPTGEPEVCQRPLEDLCEGDCPAAEELSCGEDLTEVDCEGFVVWRCGGTNDIARLYLYDEAGAVVAGASQECPSPIPSGPLPCEAQNQWVIYGEPTAEVLACVTPTDPGRECYE